MSSPPSNTGLPPMPGAPRANRVPLPAPTAQTPLSGLPLRRPSPQLGRSPSPPPPRRQLFPENTSNSDDLTLKSYETLLKQIYGQPVTVPQFLVVNNIRAPFIPFNEVGQLIRDNEIERYIVEPLLQPWASQPDFMLPADRQAQPNRIVTLFHRDGTTSLVKAKYDRRTNQIYPPQ